MGKQRKPPSQTWRTFLKNHAKEIAAMDIDEVLIAPRSPWQNPFAERVIGSIRRECLNHCIIFNESHLYQVLGSYVEYYYSVPYYLLRLCA